jgi:hypothetical protein
MLITNSIENKHNNEKNRYQSRKITAERRSAGKKAPTDLEYN